MHRTLVPLSLCLASLVALADSGAAADTGALPPFDEIRQQVESLTEAGSLEDALARAEDLDETLTIARLENLYRITALHARLGHRERVFESLERTLEEGFWDHFRFLRDDAFADFHKDERFRETIRASWVEAYLSMLERPEREAFQKPEQVMRALALEPGERVADLGAGSGYFTLRLAEAVQPGGRVLALDIRQEMLDHIAGRLRDAGVDNVDLRLVAADDPALSSDRVDTILMVDVYHYVKDKAAYAAKLREGLNPGGRVVVIDYTPKSMEERPWGPPPRQQMAREDLDAAMAEAGFVPVRVHEFLPEQYFVEYELR